eukprot:7328534-Pyramimonas_sp.AAC.1
MPRRPSDRIFSRSLANASCGRRRSMSRSTRGWTRGGRGSTSRRPCWPRGGCSCWKRHLLRTAPSGRVGSTRRWGGMPR